MKIIYDGHCGFCQQSVKRLKSMDWFKQLTLEPCFDQELTEVKLVDGENVYGGFDAFRRLCLVLPLLYPFLIIVYLPGARFIGGCIYRFIANRRYLFGGTHSCSLNKCHTKDK